MDEITRDDIEEAVYIATTNTIKVESRAKLFLQIEFYNYS